MLTDLLVRLSGLCSGRNPFRRPARDNRPRRGYRWSTGSSQADGHVVPKLPSLLMRVLESLPKHLRVDITTALMRNHLPHYALPADLLPILPPLPPESSRQIENITALMLSISPEMSSVVHIYRDLKRLAAWFENQSAVPGIGRDSLSVSLFLDPIAHRALSDFAPMMSIASSPLTKACALAALVIIISLRRKHDSFPGALPPYPRTITDALKDSDTDGPEFLTLRLWLLTISGISTTERNERQGAKVRLVAEMRAAGLQNWKGVTERISVMPWFKGLWEEECMLLGKDVMSMIHLSETETATCGISYNIIQ